MSNVQFYKQPRFVQDANEVSFLTTPIRRKMHHKNNVMSRVIIFFHCSVNCEQALCHLKQSLQIGHLGSFHVHLV